MRAYSHGDYSYRHTRGSDTARYALWVLQVHDQYIEETVSSDVSGIEKGSTYAYLRHIDWQPSNGDVLWLRRRVDS